MKLVFSRTAQRDLAEAIAFIGEHDAQAAGRQNRLIQRTANRLTRFPFMGAAMTRGRRRFHVSGTPYRLIYRVGREHVLILRVWHGARQWPPARH